MLPLCSLRFESADLRSPNRSLRGQRVTRTHDIFIAGNRIQFSRTEGKDFPSERVAVFSLFGLCCQRLSETFFSPCLLPTLFSPAFLRGIEGRERVAVFSLSGLCCQGLSKLFFSPRLLRAFFPCISAGLEGPKRVAVSSLCRLCCQRLSETFFSRPPSRTFLVPRLAARRRWGPKREAVYAPARGLPASTFVTICRFPKNPAVSRGSDRKRLYSVQ